MYNPVKASLKPASVSNNLSALISDLGLTSNHSSQEVIHRSIKTEMPYNIILFIIDLFRILLLTRMTWSGQKDRRFPVPF